MRKIDSAKLLASGGPVLIALGVIMCQIVEKMSHGSVHGAFYQFLCLVAFPTLMTGFVVFWIAGVMLAFRLTPGTSLSLAMMMLLSAFGISYLQRVWNVPKQPGGWAALIPYLQMVLLPLAAVFCICACIRWVWLRVTR